MENYSMEEKAFDEILKLARDQKEENFSYSVREMFFDSYPDVDIEKLKSMAREHGFYIERACDINSKDPYFVNLWEKTKALLIFYDIKDLGI